MQDDTGLAARLPINALVDVYEQAAKDIRDGFALISRAQDKLSEAFVTDRIRVDGDRFNRIDFDDVQPSINKLERELWGIMVGRLEIGQFMSVEAHKKLGEQLDRGELPALTRENVRAMAEGFRQQLPDMLKESVEEVFRMLTPSPVWDKFKTNNREIVGKRVILERTIDVSCFSFMGYRVYYHREDSLRALENVFSSLDGKGQISKGYYSELSGAIKACPNDGPCEGETTYFKFKGYNRGTLHITFKRLDLVKRLNEVAAGQNLKAAV